jgi:hypothetical protein
MKEPKYPYGGTQEDVDAYFDAAFKYDRWRDEHFMAGPLHGVLVCLNCAGLIQGDLIDTHVEKCHGQYK